jgi:hypothetical protein
MPMAEMMVARDGIEPPTPAFSGLGTAVLVLMLLNSRLRRPVASRWLASNGGGFFLRVPAGPVVRQNSDPLWFQQLAPSNEVFWFGINRPHAPPAEAFRGSGLPVFLFA